MTEVNPNPVAALAKPGDPAKVPDTLTLVIRVHDPKEKRDASMSACWATVKLDRSFVGTSAEKLAAQLVPTLKGIKNLKLT
jgi:hypothetical protein